MSLTKSRTFLVIVAVLRLSTLTLSQEKDEIRILEPDRPIEREIVRGDVHWYQATLSAGQFLKVIVDQRGIDAVVKLFGPDGRQLSEVDSPNGIQGPEPVSVLAKVSGSYRLEVLSVDKNAPAGRYEIRIETLREATAQDKTVDLAASLASARTEAERAALMPKDEELLTTDLERLLMRYGVRSAALGDHQQALALYQLALGIAQQRGSKSSVAGILGNIGSALMEMGDYTQALGSYYRSMALLEELGDKRGIVLMLYNLGTVHSYQGNYELALEYNRKYLAITEASGNKAMIARALPSMGNIYSAQGNYTQALEYYQKALNMFQELSDKSGIIITLQNIAHVHAMQNNTALAFEYYQKALAAAQSRSRTTDTSGATRPNNFAVGALLNIADIYHAQHNYAKALELKLKALEMAEAIGNPATLGTTLSNIGQTYLMQGNYTKALEMFQRALPLSEGTGDRFLMAHLQGNLGDVYQAQGNYADALKFEERSAAAAKLLGDAEDLWYSRMIAGKSYQALGQNTQAWQALEEAITTIENMRTQVTGGEREEQSFFEDKVVPYHAMAELLLSENRLGEAFLYAERSKSRVLLDVLRSGKADINKAMTAKEKEQERTFNNDLVSVNRQISRVNQQTPPDAARLANLRAQLEKIRLDYEAFQVNLYIDHPELRAKRGEMQPINLEEANGLLPDDKTAAVEFMVTEDKTYVFVLTKGGAADRADLKVYTVAVKYNDVADRAERFRQQLAEGDLDFRARARELYDLLLQPAHSQLRDKTTIIIVPDSVLWDLPFQALRSAENRYVIEDHAIFYAPSLTVLREMVRAHAESKNSSQPQTTLLAFGNPALSKRTVDQIRRASMDEKLEPLPEAEKQVKALSQLYGLSQSKVYTGSEAREDRVKAEAGRYRVLQFATHGVLDNRNPMYSHLVLSQAQGDSNEDGLLEAWEMMKLDLHADMVVLSACETGRGRIGAGEGIIGMSWALFVAGSPTTVVSQWKVDSASTTDLMLEFHRNLKFAVQAPTTHMTKAKALQQASLKLLRDKNYSHPFYWASFVVVGDGF
ncbi:MAG: CHAT domain-containing protein [bacterium]